MASKICFEILVLQTTNVVALTIFKNSCSFFRTRILITRVGYIPKRKTVFVVIAVRH